MHRPRRHARGGRPRPHHGGDERQRRCRQDLPVGQPRGRARGPWRARARARCRPRPGQPRRGAQPRAEGHAARRLHRRRDARRGDPARSRRLLGAARRLGAGRILAPDARSPHAARDIVATVAPRFDRILLDTGAGISDVVLYAVSLADEVLVVATSEPTSMTDAYATIKVLATSRSAVRSGCGQPGAAGRRGARDPRPAAARARSLRRAAIAELEDPLRLDLVGDVPADPAVRESVQKRRLLLDMAPGSPRRRRGRRPGRTPVRLMPRVAAR